MAQQINFYRARFRKQQANLPSAALLKAGSGAVALLLLFGLFTVWRTSALRSELRDLEEQQATARTSLEEMGRRLSAQAGDPRVMDETSKLQALISSPQPVRELLTKDLFGSQEGYSGFFTALARQSEPGVWLTRVDIVGANKDIEIRGRAVAPDRVPRYLQRLSREKSMDGLEFDVFQIGQPGAQNTEGEAAPKPPTSGRTAIDFVLRTRREDQVAKP